MAEHDGGATVRALTYVRGDWLAGNPALVGPMSHALWLGSTVFDGARAFEGVAPDLDRHAARVVRSALAMGLEPMVTAGEIEELCWDGIHRFPPGTPLYIRPMFWAESGFVTPDPTSTVFALTVQEMAMPDAGGFTAALSTRVRPSPLSAPTEAKAACLYPNAALAMREARARGFDNAILLDPLGNVAEFAIANLFIANAEGVHTPVPNGTFLAGITRARVIALLRQAGVPVYERSLSFSEVLAAEEVFATGNYAKVVPVTRVEDRDFEPGPFGLLARALYWDFAHHPGGTPG